MAAVVTNGQEGFVTAGRDGDYAVIEVSGLRMRYGSFEAVRGIDLRVGRGEVFAF